MMKKKITKFFALLTFSILLITFSLNSAFAGYLEIPNFLCERGIKYYEKGDYDNALDSFKKALLANPQGETAQVCKTYIDLIKEKQLAEKKVKRLLPEEPEERVVAEELKRELVIQKAMLEALEKEKLPEVPKIPRVPEVRKKEILEEKAVTVEVAAELEEKAVTVEVAAELEEKVEVHVKEVIPQELLKEKLVLDEELRATQPFTELELEINQAFIIEGREIGRWLVTSPEIIDVERVDLDHIKVAGKKLGPTYLHIWDQNGRWTLNIRVIPARYIKRLIEAQKKRVGEAEPFKFRYSFDRSSFHTGTRPGNVQRQTLSFNQWLGLTGETSYGDFDTSARIRKIAKTKNLSYFTMGLTDGSIWGFEDFDLRGFDYTAAFSELCLPGQALRGVRFDKRVFDERLSYSTIWGREGQGKYGRLSPALSESQEAYIFGGELNYSPNESLDYRISSFRGYGDEREDYLEESVMGLGVDYRIREDLSLGGEIGYDSDSTGLLLHSDITFPKLNLTAEFRNIENEFSTITGRPSRLGEIGAVLGAEYFPREWFNLSGNLNLYRDRLFPNPDNPDSLNLDLHTSSNITINPTTSMTLNYQHMDEEGKVSPRQANSAGVGIVKRFPDLRDLTTRLWYRYRDSANPKAPTSDYSMNSLAGSLSLRLLGDLSCYASREITWLSEEYTGEKSRPSAFETGLDYSSQLFTTPFYTTLRLSYRDEEDTTAPHSFLIGEDSVNFSGEIAFRPSKDFELFVSSRLKNTWPEESDIQQAELELRLGGRLLWDTGIHWNPQGTISGLVYKDLNDDGEKQDNEPGVEKVKLFVGEKETSTDLDGTYKFSRVRGKRATIRIDASSLPAGFVISGPGSRKVEIEQGKVIPVDFRLISRSEIYGVVFEDVDEDGKSGVSDIGISRVRLTLEDGKVAITDSKGQYYFRRVTAGEHTITLGIDSVPLDYLPTVPLTKKITLFEGITYIHNIPLKRAK